MHCSMLFGFLVGVVLFKMVRRFFWWRYNYGGHGHGCGGHGHGGCGGHRRGWRSWRGYGQWDGPQSWQGSDEASPADRSGDYGRWSSAVQGGGVRTTGKPIEELVRGLELNERQRDEAIPVLTLLRERLGVSGVRVETALKVVATDRFDPSPLISQLGGLPPGLQHELVDGVEHLHTILISEQREVLRKQLGIVEASTTPSSGPSSGPVSN